MNSHNALCLLTPRLSERRNSLLCLLLSEQFDFVISSLTELLKFVSVRNGKLWIIIVILLSDIQIFLNWHILESEYSKKKDYSII